MLPHLEVVCGDVLAVPCDVLVLKYAQGFFGVDRIVADRLNLKPTWAALGVGERRLVFTDGKFACKSAVFCGVPHLFEFRYAEIRQFAKNVLAGLAASAVEQSVIVMTMHGANYGLDEREAFSALVAGVMEHFTTTPAQHLPQRILFVERDPDRATRLKSQLALLLAESGFDTSQPVVALREALPDAGIRSEQKRHVFVAMPYTPEMEDVFHFGIREAVNEAGCLCERCDHDVFTGDILQRIKERIATSSIVVADMTGANPNVYLEVGYAWGKGIPVLLVAREGEELKFDVQAQKCIYYKNITHLRKQLQQFVEKQFKNTT